jgi:hypothetical protein
MSELTQELTQDTFTFGKYNGLTVQHVLKDRSYCSWVIQQDWFQENYPYLFGVISEYDPKPYFHKGNPHREVDTTTFLRDYPYFNLVGVDDVKLPLTPAEKKCYSFYLGLINNLRVQVYLRLENEEENPWDIKAPTGWLKKFEKDEGIPRDDFKKFLESYELPNIPYIVERIKKEGGIEYKGAKSFLIARERSREQEAWWGEILRKIHGDDIATQFKYVKCIFDFICIPRETLFECKLGLKDFSEEQYIKYRVALDKYRIIYLIGKNAIIDTRERVIYTTDPCMYNTYILNIPNLTVTHYLDDMLHLYTVTEINDIEETLRTLD